MKNNHQSNGVLLKRVVVKGKRMVMLEESEFDRLLIKADEWEPPMPEPNAEGNYPAFEALRVSLARKIMRHRRRLGLSQVELARRAGMRLASLQGIEHGSVTPSARSIEKIDRALNEAEAKTVKAK